MKIVLASAFWFLASWFVYDALAFLAGGPRAITPVVALAVAVGIGALLNARAIGSSVGHPNALHDVAVRLPG
jgi:hypothetical protein